MSDSVGHEQRAQSELLGIVLLFGLVLTVSLTVVVVGGSALGNVQSSTTTESAEVTMSEFQSSVAQVGADSAAVEEVSFAESSGGQAPMSEANAVNSDGGNEGSVSVDENQGRFKIKVTNSSGDIVPGGNTSWVNLGTVLYTQNDQRIAYQGGGVFSKNGGSDSSAMVSPPNFNYQYRGEAPTLRLPLVQVNGSASGSEFNLEQQSASSQLSGDIGTPLQPGRTFSLSIESEYYRAWGTLFEDRTDGDVDYNSTNDQVTLQLDRPNTAPDVPGPIVSRTSETELKLNGGVDIDSYDSSAGRYSSQTPGTATIYSDKDMTVKARAKVNGDIVAEGDVEVKKPNQVTGTVYHGGSITPNPPTNNYGSEVSDATVPDTQNVNGLIKDKINQSAAPDNDNQSEASTLNRIQNLNCGERARTACELSPGTYRMDSFELEGRDQLHFNTNGRTINLVLTAPQGTNAIYMDPSALMKVNGGGRVNIYTEGDVNFQSRSQVLNDQQDATQFWLYQRDDSELYFGAQADYVGVFYAPGDPGGQIELRGNGNSAIYGAVIGDIAHANAGKKIHFDRALTDASATGSGGGTSTSSTVSYLDVTLSNVEVSD